MNSQQQEKFIRDMYQDLFHDANVEKIPTYCAPNFVEDNNYDVLDYDAFVAHVKDVASRPVKAVFDIEFIVNIPGQVVIRTIVNAEDQIKGVPPISLLISYWQFNKDGLVDYCKEVEHSE